MKVRDIRAARYTVAALTLLLILQGLTSLYGRRFWLNLTDSEPVGLYRLEKFDGKLRRGELILMRVPDQYREYVYGRHWLPEGWLLFKHIGAVPGDVYCIAAASLVINGRALGPVYATDSKGRPLPRLQGCRQVPEDHFLPLALRIPRSFDGRYMGAVKASAIEGIARPVITFD